MVLTIPLARPEKGNNLIEVVSESMKELESDEWKFERKNWAEYRPLFLCAGEFGAVAVSKEPKGVGHKKFHHYDSDIIYRKTSLSFKTNNLATYTLFLWDGVGLIGTLGLFHLIYSLGTGKPFISSFKDIYRDSISTLLDKNETYEKLSFLAHSSPSSMLSFSGGEITSPESNDYKKIAPTFSKLESKIKQKLYPTTNYRQPSI